MGVSGKEELRNGYCLLMCTIKKVGEARMKKKKKKELKKYHHFPKKTEKLKNVIALVRSGAYSNYDEGAEDLIICPECEEWTHVRFNSHSCLLDLLGELTVENISVEDGALEIWIKTDEFNWFNVT